MAANMWVMLYTHIELVPRWYSEHASNGIQINWVLFFVLFGSTKLMKICWLHSPAAYILQTPSIKP